MWALYEESGADCQDREFLGKLTKELLTLLPNDLCRELKGVSRITGISLDDLMLLHIQYEAHSGCTAVVGIINDHPVLSRTLDWDMPLLKDLTIQIEVFRENRCVYKASTWAGYIGIITACSNRLAVAVNQRMTPDDAHEDADDIGLPVGFLLRTVMDDDIGFSDLVALLSNCILMCGCFIIIVGVHLTEGCILSKGIRSVDFPLWLGKNGYLVQANLEHWIRKKKLDLSDSLSRCSLASRHMEANRKCLTYKKMREILLKKPIWDFRQTIYISLLDPSALKCLTEKAMQ